MDSNFAQADKLSNIQSCDPILADIIKDCYITLEQRKRDGQVNFFELGLRESIESIMANGLEVRERQMNAFFDNFRKLLDRKSENSWIQSEQKMYALIEGLMFVQLFGDEAEMSQSIGEYTQKVMQLDYEGKLPTFEFNGVKKNVFNYFAFALETIAESISETTVSKKIIDEFTSLDQNVMLIVTDEFYKFRSANKTAELLLETSLQDLKGEYLFTILPELGVVKSGKVEAHRIIDEPVFIQLSEGLKKGKLSFIRCEKEDEITEFLFVINFGSTDYSTEIMHHNNCGIIDNAINGVHGLRKQNLSIPSVDFTSTILKNLYQIKENSKWAIEKAECQSHPNIEVINFDQLFRHISDEIKYFPNIERVRLTFDNRVHTVVKSNYQSLFSVLKNLVSNSILFQDNLKPTSIINVLVQLMDDGFVITVKDNGLGIEREKLDFIFNRGFKVNSKSENMGLGLYYAKQLVNDLGGQITVESEYFEYTEVSVQIPFLNNF